MTDLYSLHTFPLTAPGEHLFAALSAAVPGLSRIKAREAIMGGLVKLDGRIIREAKTELGASHQVELDLRHGIKRALHTRLGRETAPVGQPFTILYQDTQVLVVDKTAGIVSAPGQSKGTGEPPERGHLPELIRRALRKRQAEIDYLGVVHRLDKDTSGCIIFALTRDAQRMLHGQFATHTAGRTYRALVMGQPRNDRDTLNSKLGRGEDGRRTVVEDDEEGKDSITHFTVLNRYAQGAELEVVLETGRTHQIRVTLADIACPVYGDNVYAFKPRKNQSFGPRSPRLMLHAEELSFDHPSTGKRISVKAPIPAAFGEFIEQLKVPAVAAWQRPQAPALDDPSQARAPDRGPRQESAARTRAPASSRESSRERKPRQSP
jgi:23S rRNA pseudouridine1911/1915/1917 synthase